MSEQAILQLASGAMLITIKIAGPIILASMAVGLLVSVFQSVTQIQEMTLTFVPKVIAIGCVLAISGHWMLGQLVAYVHTLFLSLPQLLGSG